MLKAHVQRFLQFFQPFDWHHAVVCAPGMIICLVYGLFTRDTITAAIAAGSAFSVGFGLRRYRQTRSMLGAIVLTTGAAVIGSLVGGSFLLLVIAASAASAACACTALIDDDIWWVSLQAAIALFLASHYAGEWSVALHRAIILLIAGAIQMISVLIMDRVVPKMHPKPSLNIPIPATRRALITYGGVAAVSVSLAMLAAHALQLEKAYWAPMTALIVLKPKFQLTKQRGLERFLGTVAGCALATAVTLVVPPMIWIESLLCVIGSCAAYALIKARYAAFSLAVSFTAVMLLSTAHGSVIDGAEQRLYATIIGGLISITVMWSASQTVSRDFAI